MAWGSRDPPRGIAPEENPTDEKAKPGRLIARALYRSGNI